MFALSRGNTAGKDIVGRDQNIYTTHNHAPQSPLANLYEKLRDVTGNQSNVGQIADLLQHFCNALTDGDVRGLEEKLNAAGRSDLLNQASAMKQFASKTIMKWQTSGVAQDIITHVLSKMYTEFINHVTPAIQGGADRLQIDSLIGEKVIKPVEDMLGDNDLGLTSTHLMGLLFYLGGNCHVRWDKC